MKNLMLLLAVGVLGLVLTTPASAQFYPGQGGQGYRPTQGFNPGYGGYNPGYGGYNPGYGGGGYNPGYGGFNPGFGGSGRPHVDYVPGGFVPHRGHFDYVQPHMDLHIGGRRYEIQQGPFGPSVSPFSHRRH